MGKIKIDDIAAELAESAGLSRKSAKAYTKFLFQSIAEHLAEGDTVMITSFGTFSTTVYAARKARNIANGEIMSIPAKHRIKFEMSRSLLDDFNDRSTRAEDYDE